VSFLKGYKTYIGIVAAAVYSILIYAGVLASDEIVWTAIAAWTGISYRAALS
jgi:hypothetical protein